MERQKTLLQLYQLLWEQIKYDTENSALILHTSLMRQTEMISVYDETALDYSITNEIGYYEDRKQFVQRMIETLTKEQSI